VNTARKISTQTPSARAGLRRLAHPLQVGDQVADGLVVLLRGQRARAQQLVAGEAVLGVAFASCSLFTSSNFAARMPCSSHSGCGMPTLGNARLFQPVGLGVVAVVAAQVGVEVVGTGCRRRPNASARSPDRSGGTAPNHALACYGSIEAFITSPTLVGREQKVVS
jgi:hypothetical protein